MAAEGRLKTARDDLVKEPSNVDKPVAFYTAAVAERPPRKHRAKKLLVMKVSPSPALPSLDGDGGQTWK